MKHVVRDVGHGVRVRVDEDGAHGRKNASLSMVAAVAIWLSSASVSSFSPSLRAVIRLDRLASAGWTHVRSSSGQGRLIDQAPSVGDLGSFVSLMPSPVIASSP